MTDHRNVFPRDKSTPREMTSTEVKNDLSDVLSEARVGFATIVRRGRSQKPVAAIVPPEVGFAYLRQEPMSDHERTRLLAAVEQTRHEIIDALDRLSAALVADTPPANPGNHPTLVDADVDADANDGDDDGGEAGREPADENTAPPPQ